MMSDIETSESDVSYRVEDAADVSESEEYSSMVDSEAQTVIVSLCYLLGEVGLA